MRGGTGTAVCMGMRARMHGLAGVADGLNIIAEGAHLATNGAA